MARVLVASMGFTVDFIVRRVADLGREELGYVMAVGLHAGDEDSWRRVEEAYKLLSHYLTSLGIPSELVAVKLGFYMVREARDAIARAASLAGTDGMVELYLTGGPRILVTTLILAALTSTSQVRDKCRLVVYGEEFKGSIEVPVGLLVKLLKLDEDSAKIVSSLSRFGGLKADELREIVDMKRSTLYKKLKDLAGEGLVYSDSGVWRVQEELERLL